MRVEHDGIMNLAGCWEPYPPERSVRLFASRGTPPDHVRRVWVQVVGSPDAERLVTPSTVGIAGFPPGDWGLEEGLKLDRIENAFGVPENLLRFDSGAIISWERSDVPLVVTVTLDPEIVDALELSEPGLVRCVLEIGGQK